MPQIKAVGDNAPDPKLGVPRRNSGVSFPYYNLDQSVEVAKVIHERAGGSCDRAQLASLLNYKGVQNGSFLTRVTAAKLFGVIAQEGNQIRVTERGVAIVSPVTTELADAAKVDAFMAVELFSKVFHKYNGTTLPLEVGLRNLFATEYNIVPERIIPTVRVMMDSAEQAGFFRTAGNRTKMVTPILRRADAPHSAQSVPPMPPIDAASAAPEVRTGGSGSGGDDSGIHPAIAGLLRELPGAGTPLSKQRRTSLIDAFKAMIDFIYPAEDVSPPPAVSPVGIQ